MKKILIVLILLTCSRNLRGQVWTKVIDSIPPYGPIEFRCAIVDSVTNELYLAGQFYRLNQYTTSAIIKYNGTFFDTLQSGLDDQGLTQTIVLSMQMFQGKLWVFGQFAKTGKYWCKSMGRWNGTSWDTLDFNPNGYISSSDVYNNELYVSGAFDTIGGVASNAIAKFDGVNWHSLSHPVKPNIITAIKNYKGTLYMAGQVTQSSSSANLSYYDGTQWVPWVGVTGDNAKTVMGMTVIDSMLYVYGRFNSIAGTNCRGLAAFNGKNWYGFGTGLSSSGWETIHSVKKINGEIYVTGMFDKIEGIGNSNLQAQLYTNLAKFDGQKWCLISPPFDNVVAGIVNYKNNMYVYGPFKKISTDTVFGFEKWIGGNSNLGCSSDIVITTSPVGLKEILSFGKLKIYPNPVKDKLNLEFTDFEITELSLQLINSLGQIVYSSANIQQNQEIDLINFPTGIYFLKVYNELQEKTFKIFKE